MRVFKLSLFFLISALFITACNTPLTDENTYTNPNLYGQEEIESAFPQQELGWARENLDLRAVGELVEEADNAEELEYLINSRNGVNNLDLNGDGYADYISVREFDDRYDDERGFSLYSMFGSDAIQEILTIVFDRDGNGRYRDGYDEYGYYHPGSRVLLVGDEQIYGDDYYYEANWDDRPVTFVTWVFSDRDYYRSPYYYGYYPEYYQPYSIVETTVYRTRVEEYYYDSAPAFVYTNQPTVTEIKIKSPYHDRSLDRIYANLAKPTREQVEFLRNDPAVSEVVRVRNEKIRENGNVVERPEKPLKDISGKPDRVARENSDRGNPNKFERGDRGGNPDKSERIEQGGNPNKLERAKEVRIEKPNKAERSENRSNPGRVERPDSPRMEKQNAPRVERQQPQRSEKQQPAKVERQQPQRVERQKPQRTERPQPVRAERPQPQQVQRQQPQQVQRQQQPARVERPKPQQEQRVKPQGGNQGGGNKPQQGGGNGKGKIKP